MPDDPIFLRPETYARHAAAVRRGESEIRTRAPQPGDSRARGVAPGAWGRLASGDTITAASGTTLGTGQVKLCDRAGVVYPEDETVTVYNAGDSISASGGAKIVPLEWTGGEWSTCTCGGPTTYPCFPCAIPQQNLTLDWTNTITGNGSIAMTYTAPNSWDSACTTDGILYRLTCTGGVTIFTVTYFISGSCPSGQRQTCTTGGGIGSRVIRSTTSCSPFSILYTTGINDCTFMYNNGYRSFTVHE
ncbi:MAG: hypothetical protein U0790_25300 [Isosphaeraceae bacterium]